MTCNVMEWNNARHLSINSLRTRHLSPVTRGARALTGGDVHRHQSAALTSCLSGVDVFFRLFRRSLIRLCTFV